MLPQAFLNTILVKGQGMERHGSLDVSLATQQRHVDSSNKQAPLPASAGQTWASSSVGVRCMVQEHAV
jgi:hypothetical protein